MSTDQEEIDALLFKLTLECARPSWRFRALFTAHERQMLQFAINTFMGQRQTNQLMNELERRYGRGGQPANTGKAEQQSAPASLEAK